MRCGGMTDVFQWWEAGREAVGAIYLISQVWSVGRRRVEKNPGKEDCARFNMGRERREGVVVRVSRRLFHRLRSFGDNSKQPRRTNELKFVEEKAAVLGLLKG